MNAQPSITLRSSWERADQGTMGKDSGTDLHDRGPEIRKATERDLEGILRVINTTNRLFYSRIVPPERFKDPFVSIEELRREFERKDFWVGEIAGRMVGTAALETVATRFGPVGIITRMYVLPRFQRRGIGTAMIAEIEKEARGRGVGEILIWTDPMATWAVSFYRKLGYSEVDPTVRYHNETIDTRIEKHGSELLVLRKPL